jgi:protein-S-isoprenylcysteine O-methyltransferase Ste14
MEASRSRRPFARVGRSRLALRLVSKAVLLAALAGALLFAAAGSWRYWEAWLYLGILVGPPLAANLSFLARDLAFLERRLRWREKDRRQKLNRAAMGALVMLGRVLAGLDHRYQWSQVPAALVLAAAAVMLGAFALQFRVFQANRYAAATVEVEADQQVIVSGPYAAVRHPMYLSALLLFLFTPLTLASYWAVPPFLLASAGIVLRTRNEEATLCRELPGYAEYCRKVPWRLAPGLW